MLVPEVSGHTEAEPVTPSVCLAGRGVSEREEPAWCRGFHCGSWMDGSVLCGCNGEQCAVTGIGEAHRGKLEGMSTELEPEEGHGQLQSNFLNTVSKTYA